MHFSAAVLLAAATLIPSSMAHYCFNKLIVDGNYTGAYEYVRKNSNSNSPVTDLTSTDFRCNAGGLLTGDVTSTYTLAAGAEIGFGLDQAIGHPGPLQVYMAKVPDTTTAAAYDGSGDWFKVYEMGVAEVTTAGLQWASNQVQNFTFTLSEETPAGQYLLRVEHIALHGASTVGGAQFYISCAQIEVTSSSTATPAPVVNIPGVYTGTEPGLEINIYYPVPTNYTMPGPSVWPSAGSSDTTASAVASSAVALTTSAAVNSTSSAVVASASSAVVEGSSSAVSVASSSVAAVVEASSSAVSAVISSSAITTQAAVVASSSSAPYPYSFSANGTTACASTGFITITASRAPSSTGYSTGGLTAKKYYQCGGIGWTGATTCDGGATCTAQNEYYSQCL